MNPPGRILALVAGLAGGLLCGWLIFGGHPSSNDPAPGSPSAVPIHSATPRADDRALTRRATTVLPPLPGAAPGVEANAEADELQQLRTRVAQLEKKLAVENKAAALKEGSPVNPPDHLDSRFESEHLRLSLNAALKVAGLDGEVNAIDCGEYPCMAIGEIKGSAFGPDESTKVADALTKAGYEGDSKQGFGSRVEENGQARNLFGMAVFPKPSSDDERQEISKRLRYRFNESQGLE